MNFRRNAKQKLSRSWLLGLYPFFFALCQIVVNSSLKLTSKFSNGVGMKANDASDAQQPTNKNMVSLVIFDPRGVALV